MDVNQSPSSSFPPVVPPWASSQSGSSQFASSTPASLRQGVSRHPLLTRNVTFRFPQFLRIFAASLTTLLFLSTVLVFFLPSQLRLPTVASILFAAFLSVFASAYIMTTSWFFHAESFTLTRSNRSRSHAQLGRLVDIHPVSIPFNGATFVSDKTRIYMPFLLSNTRGVKTREFVNALLSSLSLRPPLERLRFFLPKHRLTVIRRFLLVLAGFFAIWVFLSDASAFYMVNLIFFFASYWFVLLFVRLHYVDLVPKDQNWLIVSKGFFRSRQELLSDLSGITYTPSGVLLLKFSRKDSSIPHVLKLSGKEESRSGFLFVSSLGIIAKYASTPKLDPQELDVLQRRVLN